MPYDSNGNFSLVPSYLAITGQTVTVSQHNPPLEDIANGMSSVLLRSGLAPMNANLPMGGYKVTGMADGTAATDAASKGQTDTAIAAAIAALGLGDASTKDVGTAAGTVAAGDDGRLTDAREWTAETVSQAEAKAGTATDRRAWTSARVRENAAASPGFAKAWVSFNGNGGATILSSFNVASVVRIALGKYTVTFTTPMANANYAAIMSGYRSVGMQKASSALGAVTATQIELATGNGGDSPSAGDWDLVTLVVFGG